MRVCYHCGRLTAGPAIFCNHCGRSYSVKFCPRLHSNPRSSEACAQCGSRELSTPQERLPLWFKPASFLAGVIPGLVLLLISLAYLGYFLIHLVADPGNLLIRTLYGLALALRWLFWVQIPLCLLRVL